MTLNQSSSTLSRRHFLQITAVAGTVFLSGRWLQNQSHTPTRLSETRLLMGTFISLTVMASDKIEGKQAIDATFAEMERLIALFNWRQADSPLARLNQTGSLLQPPAELVNVLQQARAYSDLTNGAFDVTVQPLLVATRDRTAMPPSQLVNFRDLRITPEQIRLAPGMQVTLDGIAQGRVIDGGPAVLGAQGVENILVEAGGDLVAQGTRDGGEPWRVGITHPRQTDQTLSTLVLSSQAAATSGDYQHAFSQDFMSHHIIDPRSGTSPTELASVTVLAPTAMAADALSTAVMVLGADAGLTLVDQLPQTAALVISKEMEIRHSANFPTV